MLHQGWEWVAFDTPMTFAHIAAPDAPLAGYLKLYAKTTGLFYRNAGGAEIGPLSVGISDHGGLTGLTDDDHSIYALLAGRVTGQTLKGGTASGEDLTLMSTNHATKGHLLFGTSGYDEVNNRLGIGHTVPAFGVHASGASPGCHVASTRLSADALGPAFIGQKARGTPGSPTVVLADDQLLQLVGQGFENGSYHTQANIKIFAGQNWSGSVKGTYIGFETTLNGGTTITERLRLTHGGALILGGGASLTSSDATSALLEIRPSGTAAASAAVGIAVGVGASNFANWQGRGARGTTSALTASQLDDVLARFSGIGYGQNAWAASFRAVMQHCAAENWTNTAQGTYIAFHTTPLLSTTAAERLRIEANGNVSHASDVQHKMLSQNRFRHANTMAELKRTTDQTLTTSTITAIGFDSENIDTDTLHDPSTNNSRITIRLAGKYLVGGVVRYEANGTGTNRQARVHKNGTLIDGIFNNDHSPNASQESHVFVCGLASLAAADYIEMHGFQDSGGDLDIQFSQTRLFAVYVGE